MEAEKEIKAVLISVIGICREKATGPPKEFFNW